MKIVQLSSSHQSPYPLAVVGESQYREEIIDIVGDYEEAEWVDENFTARLILDDNNIHDRGNAVAVEISFKIVGYLSKADARLYRQRLSQLGASDVTGECRANIKGGFTKRSGEQADFGVRLDLDLNTFTIGGAQQSKPTQTAAPVVPTPQPSVAKPKKNPPFIFILAASFLVFCLVCVMGSSIMRSMGLLPTRTPTAIPTDTLPPGPTDTPVPSETPLPTDTPRPTDTPLPTFTPTLPPDPIILTGSGDSIVDVPKGAYPAIMRSKYSSGGNFIVTNYDANNNPIDLLINTIGAYEGTKPLDFLVGKQTARLEIKASGPWEIQILPLTLARRASIPGPIQGTGDDVFYLDGSNPDTIVADASQGTGNFILYSYSDSGADLVFNEIAPYTGTALLDNSTFLISVEATGNWSLEITTR
jgi:hypothetical protein